MPRAHFPAPAAATATMAATAAVPPLHLVPQLGHETLYVGIDVGKLQHVAGFVSSSLLARYQRFEICPALTFAQSREGFRTLVDRIQMYMCPSPRSMRCWR